MDETKSVVFVFSSGRTGARHRADVATSRVPAADIDRQRTAEKV
jgi:hypothetical protein